MKYFLISIFTLQLLFAQNVLETKTMVAKVLENNYGVLISEQQANQAKNNSSILNSRFLPTLGANAGVNYNINNIVANLQNGTTTELDGATSSSYNANLNVSYTLFDGLGRWYNYKLLKERYALSEWEVKASMESALMDAFSAYYNVANWQVQEAIMQESLLVSQDRLKRAQLAFTYGQGNQLAVLNAQVDLNNDSIQLANVQLALENSQRTLNAVMVEDLSTPQIIDTAITFFANFEKENMYQSFKENNTALLIAKNNVALASLGVPIQRARFLPTLAASSQYGWNRANNNQASFLASSVSYGLSLGANLSWNLFDGGSAKIAHQNAKIQEESANLQWQQMQNNLERDFENAWADYLNKIYTYKAQEKNLVSSQDNFSRTQEYFKMGQANSLEFRQAQLNLLQVANQVVQSKFQAKLAEIRLLQMSGLLLETAW